MKRILICLLCAVLLCGCSEYKNEKSNEKTTVVTTIFPLYDFVRAIGGEHVETKMLIRPGSEVHSYDPLPSDMMAVYDCDLFLYIGGESDKWVDNLTDGGNVNAQSLIDSVEHHDHHGHNHTDEHIWTSPDNAVLMLRSICQKLCETDPDKATIYQKNCDLYIDEVKTASDKIRDVVSKHENPFMVVADRFPFTYFAQQYGIEYEAAFDGCAVSTDISLKTMSRLTDVIQRKNIKTVFCTELSSKNIANALSEELDLEVAQLHSAHNVTSEDFENGITYVDILYRNIKSLERGLF